MAEKQGKKTDTPESIKEKVGKKTVDKSVSPYMASEIINVSGSGLKPNAKMHAFFDDLYMNEECRLTDSNFDRVPEKGWGDGLRVNADGDIFFQFRLPNTDKIKFEVGNKVLRLTDDQTNSKKADNESSYALGSFTSAGVVNVEQEDTVSTKKVSNVGETSQKTDIDDLDASDDGGSPLAQSFRIQIPYDGVTGCYLTKIGIYLQSKDPQNGITLSVRQMSNGQITTKIVPFSVVRNKSSECHVSDNASKITWFMFETPVYLKNDTEYAFCVQPDANSPKYNLWTAKMGEKDIISGLKINQQPYSGCVFAASNATTFTAIQQEDLKFVVHIAMFNVNNPKTAYFIQRKMDNVRCNMIQGDWVEQELVRGDYKISLTNVSGTAIAVGQTITGASLSGLTSGRVSAANSTFIRVYQSKPEKTYVKNDVLTFNTGATATITGITYPIGKLKSVKDDNPDEYAVTLLRNREIFNRVKVLKLVATDTLIGMESNAQANIIAFQDYNFNTLDIEFTTLNFAGTDIDWKGRFWTNNAVFHSPEFTSIDINDDNSIKPVVMKNESFSEEEFVETMGSVNISATLSTTNRYQSPAIDIDSGYITTIENIVNNDITNEDQEDGGNAYSKYITKPVPLADGQDAEDLNVYAAIYRPAGTDVKIYYKILSGEDTDYTLEDVKWKPMVKSTTFVDSYSDNEHEDDFLEMRWELPASVKTGDLGAVQYTNPDGVTYTSFKNYQIKIVLLANTSALIPKVKDFRALALQL